MDAGGLGKLYKDGEVIINEGETGSCMYVIQSGQVEILKTRDGREVRIAVRNAGDFLGEMSLFSRELRSATVKAVGEAKILTIDKRNLLASIQKDPSLAFRIIESLSKRLSDLSEEITPYKLNR
jgi:CRP-like cAMP-binding protein